MASLKNLSSSPLTFDIKHDLLNKLVTFAKNSQQTSISDIVRNAITSYNFQNFQAIQKEHKQLSIRIGETYKKTLIKISRQKKVSIGELLRTALEAFLRNPQNNINSNNISTPMVAMKKSLTKKTVKKTAAKKAVKKATKAATKTVSKKKTAAKKK